MRLKPGDGKGTKLQDRHVRSYEELVKPSQLKEWFPATKANGAAVREGRERIVKILRQEDQRMLVIIGPCSIHDPKGAIEYATRLNEMRKGLEERMEIVMRVYFEKPRTTVGWKGLINDPHLDGSQDIEVGLKVARKLLLDITSMGMPVATEFLDPIVPQYIADLISWAAIGARTMESQTHREMASGLSMPVGLKNGTDGNIQTVTEAMMAAMQPHSFLGMNDEGVTSIVRTTGNPDVHVVLRGGRGKTNYDAESIRAAEERLAAAKLPKVLMVDCSHANSEKQHSRQVDVWRDVIQQRVDGTRSLIGLMVESNLFEGSQPIPDGPNPLARLRYGVSVTDACVGWETTEMMLHLAYEKLGKKD
jgi:3-deoxy-7-phosphoheptulonate synthase